MTKEYNNKGTVISEIYPDGRKFICEYDERGNLISYEYQCSENSQIITKCKKNYATKKIMNTLIEQAKAQVASHFSEPLTLNERTIKWGVDKNIIGENGQGTAWAQSTKLLEEAQETYDAVSDVNIEEIKDGIGDVIISATLLAHMHDLTMDECHEAALEVIEKRTGKMVDGTFVRDKS